MSIALKILYEAPDYGSAKNKTLVAGFSNNRYFAVVVAPPHAPADVARALREMADGIDADPELQA